MAKVYLLKQGKAERNRKERSSTPLTCRGWECKFKMVVLVPGVFMSSELGEFRF
jgi:hypothetical protein